MLRILAVVSLCVMLSPAPAGGAADTSADGSPVLPFLHDDFPRAIAEARARSVPLFIDVGAPW